MTSWLPLESNPDVFKQYVEKLEGPTDLEFHDLVAFEDWALDLLPGPLLAVIFVLPLTTEMLRRYQDEGLKSKIQNETEGVWFVRQTVPNACGTVAVLHTLMNLRGVDGKHNFSAEGALGTLEKAMKGKTAVERAQVLEKEKSVENVHRSMEHSGVTVNVKEDVIEHFIAFVPIKGQLYELDGRLDGPMCHGATTADTFLKDLSQVISQIMAYDSNTHNFSALAVCDK
eukprot:Protomagalhaensia_sp_Gyna_25__2129@NODE_2150_length_1257_cov_572_340722_g1776_i0_p1_GENE_NODE_2150_length_1257_cov_572_340722_g1776_i0NODE_2150_length_1257_cov_572_340722_g1776_i0_p1_ORF_typecomplete_len228_score51_40Peptidase_C12/PF01088_21/1_9e51Josephin/PF02099_17/0_00038DUF3386/PF11866_8/0_036_NODE_2150_length_1257_cov_572_340722_g1776_i074757